MSLEKATKMAVLSVIYSLDFEDRDHFVRRHIYDRKGSRYISINTDGLRRDRAIGAYYPHYSLDNLYEYCVFRNLITLLNKYGRLTGKRQFTLGHWKPLYRGGEHIASNWIIQTYADNQNQGDDLPPSDSKWSLSEQVSYIISKINYNFVDDIFLSDMQKYIQMLGKVYNGKKEETNSTIASELCA